MPAMASQVVHSGTSDLDVLEVVSLYVRGYHAYKKMSGHGVFVVEAGADYPEIQMLGQYTHYCRVGHIPFNLATFSTS